VGFLSALTALTPVAMTRSTSALALGASAGAGLVLALWKRKRLHLPVVDIAPLAIGAGGLGGLCWPCGSTLARQANVLAGEFYGRDTIPFDRYEQWRLKNPRILVCLTDVNNQVAGYFDLLPIRPATMDLFVRGQVTEGSFTHDDLCTTSAGTRCDRLYLGGIAVREPETYAGRRNASILVWALLKFIECFHAVGKERTLYALASTPEGEELLHRFGFTLAATARDRNDHHNLYSLNFSRESLRQTLATLPDWSAMVPLPWVKPSRSASRPQAKRLHPAASGSMGS
jgi:hypothetical protein